MHENTDLGNKIASAKSWRQLFAIVRCARDVNTPDGRGLYFRAWRVVSPEKCSSIIHLIRSGDYCLSKITRNYGLRAKVAELMSLSSA